MPVEIDLRDFVRPAPAREQLLFLFLLAVCLVAAAVLFKVWRTAPPFGLSRQTGNSSYLSLLRKSGTNFMQWIGCLLLGWGLFASERVATVFWDLLGHPPPWEIGVMFLILDLARTLVSTLLIVLLLFLARWHILARIERLTRGLP